MTSFKLTLTEDDRRHLLSLLLQHQQEHTNYPSAWTIPFTRSLSLARTDRLIMTLTEQDCGEHTS